MHQAALTGPDAHKAASGQFTSELARQQSCVHLRQCARAGWFHCQLTFLPWHIRALWLPGSCLARLHQQLLLCVAPVCVALDPRTAILLCTSSRSTSFWGDMHSCPAVATSSLWNTLLGVVHCCLRLAIVVSQHDLYNVQGPPTVIFTLRESVILPLCTLCSVRR